MNELIDQIRSDKLVDQIKLEDLIDQTQLDHKQRIHNARTESLAFSIFNANAATHGQSTTRLNGQCLYSQLLIDCLIQMKSTRIDKEDFIFLCKEQFKKCQSDMNKIREFEENYSADTVLQWYTKASFFHQVLNKALRTQDVDFLFRFRFFIRDLKLQLEQYRCPSPVHIYRGQTLSIDELNSLRNAVGHFISVNSFFSTTKNRDVALHFLGDSELPNKLQRVLFEIDADPRYGTKPFANISAFSQFPDEDEILMMAGSVFQVIDIRHEGNQKWTIRMRLCSDNDHELKSIIEHMKNEFFDTADISLGQIGNFLRYMGKFDDAKKYYSCLLRELPDDHQDVASCYWGLGIIALDRGEYDQSLQLHQKALEIFGRTLQKDHRHVADSHNCIGQVYESQGDFTRALESCEKALTIYRKTLGEDHPDLAMCFSNMGNSYQGKKEYSEALHYHEKALALWVKSLPANHCHLGCTHNNIANAHYSLRQYDPALHHYNQAYSIKIKSLPYQHPSIADTLKNLGNVYESMGQSQRAVAYFKQATEIYNCTVLSTHSHVIDNKNNIRRLSSRIKRKAVEFCT